MAQQKKKTTTTKKKTTGSSRSSSSGKRTAKKNQKRPIRREVAGAILLVLALCLGFSYFQSGAWLLDQPAKLCRSLFGWGYYLVAPALLLGSYILLFHRGRNVASCLVGTALLPVVFGAIMHIALCKEKYVNMDGILKLLWTSGNALESGGAVSASLAIMLVLLVKKVLAMVLLVVLFVAFLMMAFRLTPAAVIEAVRSHERVPYEPVEEEGLPPQRTHVPRRSAPVHTPDAAIDIPLDGEERVIRKNPTGGFFRKKSDNIKSPDELLAGGSAAETKIAAPVSPAAAPSAPVKPVTVEADDFDLPPFDTAPSAPAPVVPAPAPVMHTPFAAPTPSVQSAPVAAAAAATTVPAVLTDKQEDKLRRAEVDAAREEVTREIEGSDAQPQPPAYQYPPITLLKEGSVTNAAEAGAELRNNSRRLAQTLTSFGVDAQPGDVVRGPSVTRYEFTLSQGVKLSKITNLQDDIALALGASGVRIAPIPDKISVVGVEVPNKLVSPVSIRTVLESTEFTTHPSTTAFAVGKDISGKNIVGNISKLPHVLIAGTTGSGKSVCTNSLIVSMLYKSTPEEVRFIMVDPKMVELAPYNGIPHLLIPVVTDPKKAAGALQWAVYEMMKRYKMFSEHNVKDLASYNKVAETDETLKKLPSVVVVIDELADLMLVAAKEVEESICRVAQMGRAAGMHLVIATQRPSADVITGLMKANIPSRIAFAVASAMESRIILDTAGAEKLVGRGDMLYAPLGEGKPKRVQGCFISSEEIERVVNFVKENGETDYDESVIDKINAAVAEKEKGSAKGGGNAAPDQNAADDVDELLPAAIDVVMETGQASVSMLQRRLEARLFARGAHRRRDGDARHRGPVRGLEAPPAAYHERAVAGAQDEGRLRSSATGSGRASAAGRGKLNKAKAPQMKFICGAFLRVFGSPRTGVA